MKETYGINESGEMLTFILKLVTAADKAYADGKINVLDGRFAFEPLQVAGAAIKDAGLIGKELADLSENELAEILAIVVIELDLGNEFAKELTGDLIALAGQFALVLRKIREHKTTTVVEVITEAPVEEV